MTTRHLLVACGAAAAIICIPALAQQGGTPHEPVQPQGTTSAPVDRTWSSGAAMSSPALLNQLAGVWKVDVTCNEKFCPANDRPQDAARDTNARDNNTPGEKPNEPMSDQPGQAAVDPAKRDAAKHDGTKDDGAMVGTTRSYSGYAERKLIMGEQILQETAIVPDMITGNTNVRTVSDSSDRKRNPETVGQDAFRAMSFMSFDAPSNSYRLVCMDSRKGEIHSSMGTAETDRNRIVFLSSPHIDTDATTYRTVDGATKATPPNTQPGTKSDPADFSRQPARDKDTLYSERHGDQGLCTVLEIINNDQHQVTVYHVESAKMRNGERDTNREGKDGMNKDAVNNDRANNSDHNTATLSPDSIVYRAVYTRATGAEASRFQRLLNDERALTSANTGR